MSGKHICKFVGLALSAVALLAFACSCKQRHYVLIQGYAQGGTYAVKCAIDARSGIQLQNRAEELKAGIDSIVRVVDFAVSGYNRESLLSKANAGESIANDGSAEYRVLSSLTAYCDSLYLATDGVVDTRSAELFDIWGFGFKNGSMPSDAEVKAAMKRRSKLNFNAVAQGYTADLIARYLQNQGIEAMLVDIGGEMVCTGTNPGGAAWNIAIDTPEDGNNDKGAKISGTFRVPYTPCGVVTSGNYRKFYVRDGVKYSHTIDPRTGYPVSHNLLSATIIAPTSALADALATYCMVVGMEEAKALIEGRSDLEGCLISDSEIWFSPALR